MAKKITKDRFTQAFVSKTQSFTILPIQGKLSKHSSYKKERFTEQSPFSPKEKY